MPKVTDKDLVVFENKLRKWAKVLNLAGWEINVKKGSTDGYASFTHNYHGRAAWVTLNNKWNHNVTEHELHRTAKHEALEILLLRIREVAGERFVKEGDINEAIHEIIRILETVLPDCLVGGQCTKNGGCKE